MEKKQGVFSSLRIRVVRGLSHSGSDMKTLLLGRNYLPLPLIGRSGSLRPVIEGPDRDSGEVSGGHSKGFWSNLSHWVKGPFVTSTSVCRSSDSKLLLRVMGAPLAPIKVFSSSHLLHLTISNDPIQETLYAQYVLLQYTTICGVQKKSQDSFENCYAMGKLTMITSELEAPIGTDGNRNLTNSETGVNLWHMNPDKWFVDLSVGGSIARAGCNGTLVWRSTTLLGSYTAQGPVRPPRRLRQRGLR